MQALGPVGRAEGRTGRGSIVRADGQAVRDGVASEGRIPLSRLGLLASAACGVGAAVSALALAGVAVPGRIATAAAIVCVPVSLAAALGQLLAIRRGPPLWSFPLKHAIAFRPEEASRVRAAAQVRGGLGGAGHVRPLRLMFPALAWIGAGALVAFTAGGRREAAALALAWLAASLAATLLLPARPFWYRERSDGAVLVFPPDLSDRMNGQGTRR